jgi:tRNA(Ile)-lysidine synthase
MSQTPPSGDPWQRLQGEIAGCWPCQRWRDVGVVVGCSGGADSVALLAALSELRENPVPSASSTPRGFLVAAHMNHRLRGAESDSDEQFVRQLADRWDLRCEVGLGSGTSRDEAALRTERLRFLTETASRTGARYLALAHSASDNVETVLHHLFRGTGPAGLAGIGSPRSIGQDLVLVRPLLSLSRNSIRDALRQLGQSWREDSSNADTDYRRNWIRQQLIPLIESQYPCALNAVGRAIEGQREWRALVDRLAEQWLATHRLSNKPLTVQRDPAVEPPIVAAAAQIIWTENGWPRGEMSREHWLRLAETIRAGGPERYTLPARIDVIARGGVVEINHP